LEVVEVKLMSLKFIMPLILALTLSMGCAAGLGLGDSDGEIISYSFLAANNSLLSADVIAEIDGSAIRATVPEGTDVEALIADYVVTSGVDVSVNGSGQTSGETSNDFSDSVTYTVTAESTMTNDYTVFVTSISSDVLTGVFVSQVIGDDDTGDGTQENPYATIAKGIEEATPELKAVRVGQGTYTIDEAINIVEGVSLYGGYDESDWSRDITDNVTEVRDGRTTAVIGESVIAVVAEDVITNSTVMDGFTIVGADVPGFEGVAASIMLTSNASPTISNNRIEGPRSAKYLFTMFMTRSSPIIIDNVIEGGYTTMGGSLAYVIMVGNSAPWIGGNTVSGGTAASVSAAIVFVSSGGIISENTIDGGESEYTNGIILTTSYAAVYNNVIDAGSSLEGASGIFVVQSSSPIENNTIGGGMSQIGYAASIMLDGPLDAAIINNVLFTPGSSGSRYCVREDDDDSQPLIFQNNDLFDCPTALYHEGLGANLATTVELETYLTGKSKTASDNEAESLTFDDEFRIIAGPISVTEGGMDLSDVSIPLISVTADKDGELRTVPYSMGAYQY
jgi:hypothetical protein